MLEELVEGMLGVVDEVNDVLLIEELVVGTEDVSLEEEDVEE